MSVASRAGIGRTVGPPTLGDQRQNKKMELMLWIRQHTFTTTTTTTTTSTTSTTTTTTTTNDNDNTNKIDDNTNNNINDNNNDNNNIWIQLTAGPPTLGDQPRDGLLLVQFSLVVLVMIVLVIL